MILEKRKYISLKDKKLSEKELEKIKRSNQKYIKKQLIELDDYFDHVYDDIDPNVKLDENQRIAILTEEDYNLIVAGAGTGKTTTMIAKIKYLIEKTGVKEEEILAISFANKNVAELKHKLNSILKLNVNVKTFHGLGLDIINENSMSKVSVINDAKRHKIFNDYFKHLYGDKKNLKKMADFLSLYYHIGSEMDNFNTLDDYFKYANEELKSSLKNNYETYNQRVIEKRSTYKRSVNDEYVRSNEELKIANYLFLNNIEYEYEKRYIYGFKSNTLYHPDFTIKQGENSVYLEHFGINQNGTSTLYNKENLGKYIKGINFKEQLHLRNGTTLIKTFSNYNDKRPLLDHLKEELTQLGFVLKPKSSVEIFDILVKSNNNSYFYHYLIKVSEFISRLKLEQTSTDFLNEYLSTCENKRTKMFIETIIPIYNYYEQELKNNNMIDFEDMIIKASKVVNQNNFILSKNYKYLIIDEYQDISKQRFALINNIIKKFSSKITAVGDDWQSIFGFAGSDVSLFTKFQETLGYAEILKITNTYRSSQELIDVAGEFVKKDTDLINKNLKSTKHVKKPVVIYSYEQKQASRAKAVLLAVNNLINEYSNNKILLIGRYNSDLTFLLESGLFSLKNEKVIPIDLDIELDFCTVHKSKGLEYDNVVIINAIDHTYGFPSKIKNDPIFEFFGEKENLAYAEERRLFYVALTRTKNKVAIIVPKNKPSPFVLELKNNLNVEFKDDVIKEYEKEINATKCPKCGQNLIKKYFKDLDQYIYECVADKEVCGFKTTELKYKVNLESCPSCNGYLMFKKVIDDNLYIGCSNYSVNGDGCNYNKFIS